MKQGHIRKGSIKKTYTRNRENHGETKTKQNKIEEENKRTESCRPAESERQSQKEW